MKWLKLIIACGLLSGFSLEAMDGVRWCWEFWGQGSLVNGQGLEERLLGKHKTSFEDNDALTKPQKIDRFDQVNNQGQGLLDLDDLDVSYDTEIGDFQLVHHGCKDVDCAAVLDKKAALDRAAALVASGVSDYDSAFYLVVDAFINECTENSKEFEEPRKLLCRALLQRYVRESVVIAGEPEKLCSQIESNQVKERCKAAVQLYYLSLQEVQGSNSEEANRFALLSVFYWLDEKPCSEWYKVFNNHLKLLLRRRYNKVQEVSLKLFELYEDRDEMRYYTLTLFAELYVSGYYLEQKTIEHVLASIDELVSAKTYGMRAGHLVTENPSRLVVENNIKVSHSVLAMLERMIENDLDSAEDTAFAVAKVACSMYRYSPNYTMSTTTTLETYRLGGFALLKQLALKGIFHLSFYDVIVSSKKSGNESCAAVIALRDEVERLYRATSCAWSS